MKNKLSTSEQTVTSHFLQPCKELLARIEQTRNKIINEFRETAGADENLFQLASNEAEALVWQTDYPHLLFPSLAVEKIQAVAAWRTRQRLLQRHHLISGVAA